MLPFNVALKTATLIILLGIYNVDCWKVLLSTKEYNKGQTISIRGYEGECVDIPVGFSAKSINTKNYCVKAFDEKNCEGNWLSFFPGSFFHTNLTHFKLNIMSFKSCETQF